MSFYMMIKIINKALLIVLLMIWINGCSYFPSSRISPSQTFTANQTLINLYPESVDYYLNQATATLPPESIDYQLLAAGRLVEDGLTERAKQLLILLNSEQLTLTQLNKKIILQSKLDLLKQHPKTALRHLSKISKAVAFLPEQEVEYRHVLAMSYEQIGEPVKSSRERMALDGLLQRSTSQTQNIKQLWIDLKYIDEKTLNKLLTLQQTTISRGWLNLALFSKQYENDAQQLMRALQTWRMNYPNHPAYALFSDAFDEQATQLPSPPQNIALLLPLEGPFAKPGRAIREGFMDAYYQARQQTGENIQIQIHDTSQNIPITELYEKAVKQGADFIVGPLNKRNVQTLLSDPPSYKVPTLLLNETKRATTATMFYQFALSPQDEARQVAIKASTDGHHNALMITPKGSWGTNIARAFTQTWEAQGGKIVGSTTFSTKTNLSNNVRHLLHVDQSQQRHKQLEKLFDEKLRSIGRRREDIDMVFLVAYPTTARQILPLLRFYYAGDIPVYATSLSYNATPSPKKDEDLNNLLFADMPWIFGNGGTQQQRYNKKTPAWPNSFNRYARLYALGADAFKLTSRLPLLSLFPQYGFSGLSGTLYMDNQHRIQRKLKWAKMRKGMPVLSNNLLS